ncbi:hypothetical protein LPJ61_003156 [Coemansia biformis]|uniref:Bacterial surface antigen (D15) domain-containing protein n=1 Tax=Coemansia biformis TaxID=1286918 RepID=A0A9W7YEE7_9FUNG|nr:hypothetical protein LPJ61_003156 [Coemansia biformis]
MAASEAGFDGPSARGIFGDAFRAAQGDRGATTQVIDVSQQALCLNQFHISGISRIRRGFLATLLERLFEAKTVEQAVLESREAAGKLQALGIAKHVVVELDRAEEGREGVDVHFRCEDGSRYVIKTGVDVGDNEGTASVAGRLNNIWGGGESLEAIYSRGSKTQAAFQGTLLVPVDADPQKHVELRATQVALDARPYSAHDDVRRAVSSAFRAVDAAGRSHGLRYLAEWRELCNLGSAASPTLRADAGHTLKSSVEYTFVFDDRDSATVPTSGSIVRATAEVAGLLGGDVRFAKARAEMQTNQRLGKSEWIVSTGAQGGLLWSFDGPRGRSPLADRFFLGGQTTVRGFEHRGIGPHDHNDSVGGDVFYAAGVSLLTPLPYVRTTALKGHLWANAGQLGLLDDRGLLREPKNGPGGGPPGEIRRFFMRPSVAVGFGLVYRHSIVRAELSCCLPLVAATSDRPKAGLQFGLGVQFL